MLFSLTHGFSDANITKMYEDTKNGTQCFGRFCSGCIGKSDKGPYKKTNKQQNISIIQIIY